MSNRVSTRTLPRSQLGKPSLSLSGILRYIAKLRAARHQRKTLAAMENHRLSDLGLTREQVDAEAKRPIWDVPASWRL